MRGALLAELRGAVDVAREGIPPLDRLVDLLGAAYVQRDDSHLSIDSLRRLAGPRLGRALDALRLGVIAACSLVVIWQGVALSLQTLPLEYPAMGVSRAWIYARAPVCFAIGLV